MKALAAAFTFVILLAGCNFRPDTATEQKAVRQARDDFYHAVSTYNFRFLRELCSDDFTLVQDGRVKSLDSLINAMWGMEGSSSVTYTFDSSKITIEGEAAWMTYTNHESVKTHDRVENTAWIESAVFRKEKKAWKLALLHSTKLNLQ